MSNSPQAAKQKDREAMGRTRSSSSIKPSRYRCLACSRSRSFTYHLRHPPEEPPPPQGICRRCIEKERQKEQLPLTPEITIYEIHHYYQACAYQHGRPPVKPAVELPLSSGYPTCVELPAEDLRDRSFSLYQLLERAPPPVAFWTKPGYRGLRGQVQ